MYLIMYVHTHWGLNYSLEAINEVSTFMERAQRGLKRHAYWLGLHLGRADSSK